MEEITSNDKTLNCEIIPQLNKDDFDIYSEDGQKKNITECIYDEEKNTYILKCK